MCADDGEFTAVRSAPSVEMGEIPHRAGQRVSLQAEFLVTAEAWVNRRVVDDFGNEVSDVRTPPRSTMDDFGNAI